MTSEYRSCATYVRRAAEHVRSVVTSYISDVIVSQHLVALRILCASLVAATTTHGIRRIFLLSNWYRDWWGGWLSYVFPGGTGWMGHWFGLVAGSLVVPVGGSKRWIVSDESIRWDVTNGIGIESS